MRNNLVEICFSWDIGYQSVTVRDSTRTPAGALLPGHNVSLGVESRSIDGEITMRLAQIP